MHKGKKAQEKPVFNTIIDIVLVAAALIVLYWIGSGLIHLMTSNSDEDVATQNNFKELAKQIKEMDVYTNKDMPIFVSENSFIIGFERGQAQASATGCTDTNIKKTIKRPVVCGAERPCLCLCKKDDACEKDYDCISDFDSKFDFKGGSGCSIALVSGKDDPQTIFIARRQDDVLICSGPCG